MSLRVAWIVTAPQTARGSMPRYADVLQSAFAAGGAVQGTFVRLAGAPRPLRPWCSPRWHHLWVAARARRILPRLRADLIHVLDGSHAYVLAWAPRGVPVLVTVHDLIPWLILRGDLPGPRPSRAARVVIAATLCRLPAATGLVVESEATARDLTKACPALRVPVRHVPIPLQLDLLSASASVPPTRPFILHIGNDAAYKNREMVVRVFAAVAGNRSLELVLAGAPVEPALRALAVQCGVGDRIRSVPWPDDAAVAALYGAARLLLFPSRYEGFGWPPLEAMAAGCPVVCSNAAALPEVAGSAALLAAPDDLEGLAAHCRRVLDDDALASDLRARGKARAAEFSLDRFTADMAAAYLAAGKGSCRI